MRPTKTNLNSGCTPVSSNCVLWQGPCLDCLNIQTGDTISDTTYKLATELCELMDQLNLSDLDLKCLITQCAACPEPEKTLSAVLQLLIDKVCALADLIGPPDDPVEPEEMVLNIAACFQTTDLNGDLITQMKISDYVRAIGNKVCALQATVDNHTNILDNHETRITILENADHSVTLPTVAPTCIYGTDTTPKEMNEFLSKLEEQFCLLRGATGTPNEIAQSVARQCAGLNNEPRYGGSGNMAGISGWKSNTATAADAINNLWLTICDMRSGLDALAECCKTTCKDIVVDFLPQLADQNQTLRLNFAGYSEIPGGFSECSAQGSKITVSDQSGESYSGFVNVAQLASSGNAYTLDLTQTNLSIMGTLNVTIDSCLTDGSLTCNKVVAKTVSIPNTCSAPTNVSATVVE